MDDERGRATGEAEGADCGATLQLEPLSKVYASHGFVG